MITMRLPFVWIQSVQVEARLPQTPRVPRARASSTLALEKCTAQVTEFPQNIGSSSSFNSIVQCSPNLKDFTLPVSFLPLT